MSLNNTTTNRPQQYKRPYSNKGLYWFRNPNWLALPDIDFSEQKFIGLVAISDGLSGTPVAFTATGNYTVDWGDGLVENYTSGTKAQHIYYYDTIDPATETDRYRQVLITVTPQAGQNLLTMDFNQSHYLQTNNAKSTYWLEAKVNGASLTTFRWSATSIVASHDMCESIIIQRSNISSFYYYFRSMTGLKSVYLYSTALVTDTRFAFAACASLTDVSLKFKLTNGCDGGSMFTQCQNLRQAPDIDMTTGHFWTMNNFFNGCYNLDTVPKYKYSNTTNMSYMFANCYSLIYLPDMTDTTLVTDMSYMFNNCYQLSTIPKIAFNSVSNASGMFAYCSQLRDFPDITPTTSLTNTSQMFSNCISLKSIRDGFDLPTTSGPNMNSMFTNCRSLTEIPSSFRLRGNVGSIFTGCRSLTRIGYVGVFNPSSIDSSWLNSTQCSELLVTSWPNTSTYIQNNMFTKDGIALILPILPPSTTARTLYAGTNPFGTLTPYVNKQVSTTAGSNILNLVAGQNTSGLIIGMCIGGTPGISSIITGASATASTDTINSTSHGLTDGKLVSFSLAGGGITTWYPYYVVNSTTNTFQISTTLGGAPLNITSDVASVSFQYGSYITDFDSVNNTITIDVPASSTNALVYSYARDIDFRLGELKNWTLAG